MQAMRNLETCGFSGQGASVCARTEEVLRNPSNYGITDPFQLVSITPPYEEVVYSDLIDAVCNSPVVVADTLVVIEYPEEMGRLPFILGGDCLYGIRNRRYGRTVLGIYVYRPNKKYNMRPDEFSI
jgi:16S rRNA (guanine966-N2)-methyltransferase